MKKQTLYLLVIGLLLIGFGTLSRPYLHIDQNIDDFLKGVGIAFVISGLFFQARKMRGKKTEQLESTNDKSRNQEGNRRAQKNQQQPE